MSGFRVLGPVEAWANDRRLALGGPRQRVLLAFLLLNANRAISADAVIDAVWGSERDGAVKRLQMGVVRLRKALAPLDGRDGSRLRTVSGGYLLELGPGELDAAVFDQRVQDGRRALGDGDPVRASELLAQALDLWRGPPLAEVAFEDFAQNEIRRLEELRLSALEARIDADLQLGRHAELIGELETLVVEEPTREHLTGQLMTTLYRSGRQADALDVYQRTRAHLGQELGLQPGPALQTLQVRILEQDASLLNSDSAARQATRSAGWDRSRGDRDETVAAPATLPVPPTATVGRAEEVDVVRRFLTAADVRLVTLTGPGGVGKTRIALVAARALVREFPNGVAWVELAGIADAQDVGSAILHALDVIPLPGESAAEALLRYLASKQMLVVLDNFEHVLGAAPLVAELLTWCPGMRVLATSREALQLAAEQRVPVAPLPMPPRPEPASLAELEAAPAPALFLAAAGRHSPGFVASSRSAPAIATICQLLDGLPLALELAAPRIALLSPDELATQLLNQPRLGRAPRDAPARHHTIEATIDWSYKLLDEDQQRAFRHFSVFAGGATIEAVDEVIGADVGMFEELVAKSVIYRRPQPNGITRLAMLNTLRDYALVRLVEDPDQDDVRRRHAEYCLALVERLVPRLSTHDQRDALAALGTEIENLRSALEWALQAAPPVALRLAGQLGQFWRIRHDVEGLRWLDAAIHAAGDDAPVGDRARAHFFRAHQLSLPDEVMTGFHKAVALYRESGDHRGISAALCSLAVATGTLEGDVHQERRYAEEACHHARLADDPALLGEALGKLATVSGHDRRALLDQAIGLLARAGNYREIASAANSAAYVALTEGRNEEAAIMIEQSLTAIKHTDDPYLLMLILGTLGFVRLFSGDASDAQEALAEAVELCRDHAFRHETADGLAGLAAVAAAQGHDQRAAQLRGIARASGYPPTTFDKRTERQLEQQYFRAARSRIGAAAWRRYEEAGAAMASADALSFALAPATRRHEPPNASPSK